MKIQARVHLLPQTESSKTRPVSFELGYYPSLLFWDRWDKQGWDVRCCPSEGLTELTFGDGGTVELTFLTEEGAAQCRVGRSFLLWELGFFADGKILALG